MLVEVIVGTLLLNIDTVDHRIYARTYILGSLGELDRVFASPKHEAFGVGVNIHLTNPALWASISRAKKSRSPIPTHHLSSSMSR